MCYCVNAVSYIGRQITRCMTVQALACYAVKTVCTTERLKSHLRSVASNRAELQHVNTVQFGSVQLCCTDCNKQFNSFHFSSFCEVCKSSSVHFSSVTLYMP